MQGHHNQTNERHFTYSEIFRATFNHQFIRLWLVFVVQCVEIEARLLQYYNSPVFVRHYTDDTTALDISKA